MDKQLVERFARVAPNVDFWSLRWVHERQQEVSVKKDVVQPVERMDDEGAMVTIIDKGGLGYAATSDLSEAGLRSAVDEARAWAERSRGRTVTDYSAVPMPHPTGSYESVVAEPWTSVPMAEKIELLRGECARLKVDERIVSWGASLWHIDTHSLYITSGGGRVEQRLQQLVPDLAVVANVGSETQSRTFGGRGVCRQGGLEILDAVRYREQAPALAAEALELLTAPNCPSGAMDLVLDPDEMYIQIHESIGHPLELDRILGDERNYAGTSFVSLDMFGSYRYGSDLLNVTFDPTEPGEFANYAFDDDGVPATREYIIREGILERPLGSVVSRHRAGGIDGVANARATSWNRPAIDRMANINVEPGTSSFDDIIGSVERGVWMKTNNSWSIDDSRNKFQFGCEWGRLIEKGELTTVVKNPNYRGVSATFWRNLAMVGDRNTVGVYGSPYCGKGEPNQIIRVGHAAPVCRFSGVDVFGGE